MVSAHRISVFLVCVGLTSTSTGQIRSAISSLHEIEIFAGASSVTFTGLGFPEFNQSKIGFTGGIGGNWQVSHAVLVSAKLQYERRGVRRSYETHYFDDASQEMIGTREETTNLDYLSLPLSARVLLTRKLFLDGGVYLSYLWAAQNLTNLSWKGTDTYNAIDYYTPFDFGLRFGIGYRVSINTSSDFLVWASCENGLVDVSTQTSSVYETARNLAVTIGVSFCITRNKKG